MPRGRPRVYESDAARTQARNQRRREQRQRDRQRVGIPERNKPLGRPRIYESEEARNQARNQRRRERRRRGQQPVDAVVVVGSSSPEPPPYIDVDDDDDDTVEDTLSSTSPEPQSQQGSPFTLLGTSSVLRTVVQDPDLGHSLIRKERTAFDASSQGYAGSRRPMMHPQKATGALAAFYEKIHTWYPILPLAFPEQYFRLLSGTLAASAESCLALLVAAVGCVVQDEETRRRGDLHERSDLVFFEAALASLPIVISECSLVSVQCALLFALYYCSLMKPCQAHDYSLIASFKIQSLLTSFPDIASEDAEKSELTNRAYWAALLLENELSVQLDIGRSDLWKYDESIPLPGTWETESAPQATSPTTAPSPGSIGADASELYFRAEIAMRRILHRWHVFSPGIARRLERQLESWYNDLPEIIRFNKEHSISPQPVSGSWQQCPLTTFLRVQYYCCKLSIYWPGVYEVILLGEASDQLLDHCKRFFNSYIQLMHSIVEAFQVCIVNRWTLFVSMFLASMAAKKAAASPVLSSICSDRLFKFFVTASTVDRDILERSPSLVMLQGALDHLPDPADHNP